MKYVYLLKLILILFIISCNNKNSQVTNKIKFCNQLININEETISCIKEKNIDLKPLLKFKKIVLLDLSESEIIDFSILSKIKSLKYLLLMNTNFKDSNILSELINLEEIFLSKTVVKNIDFVNYLNKLRVLYIDNTLITNISLLKKYSNSCKVEFNFNNTKVRDNDIINIFFKYREYFNYKPKIKIKEYYSKAYIKNLKVDYPVLINKSCLNKHCRSLIKYKDFRLSLYAFKNKNLNKLNLFNYIGACKHYVLTFENIMFLKHFNKLEVLKLHLSSNKQVFIIENLKYLKKLYLSGNIDKINKLTKNLKNLYLYNTKITNFDFLKKSNIKNLEIISNNSKSIFWQNLIKRYPNISIKVFDAILFTLTEFDKSGSESSTIIDDSSIKYSKEEVVKRNRITENNRLKFLSLNKIINTPKYYGAFIDVNYEQYKSILELRQLIIDEDWTYLLLTNNYTLINYLIKNYNFNFNKLDKDKKTILDAIINDVDKKIIDLIRRSGAKRACEVLKTKCNNVKDISNRDK